AADVGIEPLPRRHPGDLRRPPRRAADADRGVRCARRQSRLQAGTGDDGRRHRGHRLLGRHRVVGAPAAVRSAHPPHLQLRRYRDPVAAVGAADARAADHPGLRAAPRRARDGQVHELGAGHRHAAARRVRAGCRRQSDLQAAPVPRDDHLPRLPVHPPCSCLERAGLVSRPHRLSGGAHDAPRVGTRPGAGNCVHRIATAATGACARSAADRWRRLTMCIDTVRRSEPAVVVAVNDAVIKRAAIAREVQNHADASPKAAWDSATRALVVRGLLLQRARSLGLAAEPRSEDGLRETDDEALIRALLELEVRTPTADEASCLRYYRANQARFRSPDLFEPLHILFKAPRTDEAAYAKSRVSAEAVLTELASAPDRFERLARALSDCPSARDGGRLGQVTQAEVTPEFATALD